jgi:DNA-binding CsgD family transcriptional regulator
LVLSPEELEAARVVCTARQRQLLGYYARGYGAQQVALALNLDKSTVRGGIAAGLKNIAHELERRNLEGAG